MACHLFKEAGDGFVVFFFDHCPDVGKHLLYIARETQDFQLCLQDGDFWCLHEVCLDVFKAEFLVFIAFLFGQQTAYNLLHLRDEAYEDGGVGDVETGVEHGEDDGQERTLASGGGVVGDEVADGIDEGIEHAEYPYNAEDIEHKVGEGGTTCLKIGTKGSEVGGGSGADVFTHDEGYAEVDGQYARGAQQDGDCHDGCRRLHYAGYDGADKEEDDDGKVAVGIERLKETDHCGIVFQVEFLACRAKHDEREEHEGYAVEKVACDAVSAGVDEQYADEEGWIDHGGEIDAVAKGHDPCREGSADVGTHDDGDVQA